jgi:hypothetical protein
MKVARAHLKQIIREEISNVTEGGARGHYDPDEEWMDIDSLPSHQTGEVSPLTTVQKIESSYHELQDAFDTIDSEIHQQLAAEIITQLETLMDTMEHPEDYRE